LSIELVNFALLDNGMGQQEKKLTRSSSDKVVAGVLGGLAEYFGFDISLVRLVFVLAAIFSAAFPGLLVYIIMWIVIPVEDSPNYQN
jgi:phage shock protein C